MAAKTAAKKDTKATTSAAKTAGAAPSATPETKPASGNPGTNNPALSAAKKPPADQVACRVLSILNRDGKEHAVGADIDLPISVAERLAANGVVTITEPDH